MVTRPVVGGSRPAITRSKVDLPTPDGPMMATNRPAGTSRLKSRSTSVAWPSRRNVSPI